jgi:hypothetical protein
MKLYEPGDVISLMTLSLLLTALIGGLVALEIFFSHVFLHRAFSWFVAVSLSTPIWASGWSLWKRRTSQHSTRN